MLFSPLLVLATSVAAQAVTSLIEPSSAPPAGCLNSRRGTFHLTVESAKGSAAAPRAADVPQAAPLQRRQGDLVISLTGGILTDSRGRTGYIASNYQFQFDKPPQAGAIYTGGWSICPNGSLALGGQALFWSCSSGSSFDNLYDRDFQPSKCLPVYFAAVEGAGSDYSTSPPEIASTGAGAATSASSPSTATMATMTTATTEAMAPSVPATTAAPAPSVSPASNDAPLVANVIANSMFGGALGVLLAFVLA